MKSNREYRDLTLTIHEDDEEKKVRGYASTFNEPYTLYEDDSFRFDEVVDADAFATTDMSDVIMQYNHEGRVFARTKNGTLGLSTDQTGLHIRADLGGTEIGRQLYEEIEGGYTDKMSFGFRVGKDKQEQTEERDENGLVTVTVLRTIQEISKLYDVSAVSIPANDATSISARNLCDGVIEKIKEEFLARDQRERQKRKIRLLMEVK